MRCLLRRQRNCGTQHSVRTSLQRLIPRPSSLPKSRPQPPQRQGRAGWICPAKAASTRAARRRCACTCTIGAVRRMKGRRRRKQEVQHSQPRARPSQTKKPTPQRTRGFLQLRTAGTGARAQRSEAVVSTRAAGQSPRAFRASCCFATAAIESAASGRRGDDGALQWKEVVRSDVHVAERRRR